jgi:hypothetical protein
MDEKTDNSISVPSEKEIKELVKTTLNCLLTSTKSVISDTTYHEFTKSVSKVVHDLIETTRSYHNNDILKMFADAYQQMEVLSSGKPFGEDKHPLFINVPLFIPLPLLSLFMSIDSQGGALIEGIVSLSLYLQKHLFQILNVIVESQDQFTQSTKEMLDKGWIN